MPEEKHYTHDFDLRFSIQSDHEDPDDIDPEELRQACQDRVSRLVMEELREAFSHVETISNWIDASFLHRATWRRIACNWFIEEEE